MNTLDAQHEAALLDRPDFHARYLDLVNDFARLNYFTISRPFPLEALAARATALGPSACDLPAFENLAFMRRDGRPAAILVQPFNSQALDTIRARATPLNLSCHVPPNPRASLWFPGVAFLVVLTHSEAEPIRWLLDQLEFTEGAPGDRRGTSRR